MSNPNLHDFSDQESVNPVLGSGNASATKAAYGATLKTIAPRGVMSTVDRAFKVTYVDGTRAIRYFLAGIDYPHRVVGISTTAGSAITNVSRLITPCY